MSECNRCGKCCFFSVSGITRKCHHLILLKSGKTLCRIYKQRQAIDWLPLPVFIADGIFVYCSKYSDGKHVIEGCPLNEKYSLFVDPKTENKPE